MILYLCRHGIAQDSNGEMDDAQRPLTDEGRRKFRRIARGFRRLEPKVDVVVASPLVRAQQTASILVDVLGAKSDRSLELVSSENLAPPGGLEELLGELRRLPGDANVVAVGHEPILGNFLGRLCFNAEGYAPFKKGGMAAVELAPAGNRGALLWFLQPRQLRALG